MADSRDSVGTSVALCRALAERAPSVALAVTEGEAHRLTYASPAFCRLVGVTEAALVGRPVVEAVPECRATAVPALLDRVYRTGEAAHAADLPHPEPSGETSYWTCHVSPLLDPHDRPEGLFLQLENSTREVLARRPAEQAATEMREVNQRLLVTSVHEQELMQAAQAAERRETFLAQASHQLAASLDHDGTLAGVTHLAVPILADWAFIDLLQQDGGARRCAVAHADPTRAELARQVARFAPGPDWQTPEAAVLRSGMPMLMPELSAAVVEAFGHDADHRQTLRAVGARSMLVVPFLAHGRTFGVLTLIAAESGRRYDGTDLVVAEDLARRAALAIENARLYQDAQAATREARDAGRAREAFLVRASHELRTPLTSALGTVRLLRKALAGQLKESPAALVDMADRNLATMLALINDLLDASRLASGRETLAVAPVDVALVIGRTLEMVGAAAREKGLTVRVAVPPDLRLPADADRLEQVLTNLLANAVKFTPAGGDVVVEAETRETAVVLRVRDTGEGLAREDLERIFEPFVQVEGPDGRPPGDRRTRRTRGTGLGLAICRQIVTLHGGQIWAESEGPGRGSTFVVSLPLGSAPRRAA